MIRFVDKEQAKRNPRTSDQPSESRVSDSELEGLYHGLQPAMHRPKPSPDALAAALCHYYVQKRPA